MRAPLRAPTPISELPSIRLADGYEAPEEGDVYDGVEEAESVFFPVLWLWTKRIVLAGGLVAVGVLAARNWDTWFPRAAELGQTVFTEIDRQAHSAQRAREREQALTNATERCPHLAPATIRLVLSTSSDGVLEPPEVFQLATEAADRGIGSLAPAERRSVALQRVRPVSSAAGPLAYAGRAAPGGARSRTPRLDPSPAAPKDARGEPRPPSGARQGRRRGSASRRAPPAPASRPEVTAPPGEAVQVEPDLGPVRLARSFCAVTCPRCQGR
jgi:hypothetical protein